MPTYRESNGYFEEHRTRYWFVTYYGVQSPIYDGRPASYIGWRVTPENVREVNPIRDYKVLIAKKANATGPYSVVKYRSRNTAPATCHFGPKPDWTGFGDRLYGSDSWLWIPDVLNYGVSEVSDSTTDDQALARLKRKLASNQGNFESMIPLAEIHELRGSIKKAANMAKDMLEALIAIRKTKGRSASRYAAGVWLNFNFGILPVIDDARKAAESIQNFLRRQDRNLVVKGTAEKRWKSGFRVDNITGNTAASVKVTYEFQQRLLYSYTCGWALKVSAGNNYNALEHLGFNFKDLPAVGWELIPYSWVVDYFTTAGEFMSDLFESPPGNLIYLSLAKMYNLDGKATYEFYTQPHPDTILLGNSPGSAELEHIRFTRSSLGSLPHRALRFKTVDEIGLHSVTKVINLASVLLK